MTNLTTKDELRLKIVKRAILCSSISYESMGSDKYQKLINDINQHSESGSVNIEPFYKKHDRTVPAGYAIRDGKKLIIAYHGTQNLEEAKNDLDARGINVRTRGGSYINVHRGFATELESSNDSRKGAINAVMQGCEPEEIIYTGHSLGGALAPLAAQTDGVDSKKARVIVFGAPKFAGEGAAKDYQAQGLNSGTIRLEQDLDPVTALPLPVMGYVHVGHRVEVPVDLSDSIHKLDGGYDELIDGRHRQKTFDQLIKLDLTKIVATDAYKLSFDIVSYKKSVMTFTTSLARMHNLPRPMKNAAMLTSLFMGGAPVSSVTKVNPALIRKGLKNFSKF